MQLISGLHVNPQRKGAQPAPQKPKAAVQTGPRGGKFIMSGGQKIYVDDTGKPQAVGKDTGGFRGREFKPGGSAGHAQAIYNAMNKQFDEGVKEFSKIAKEKGVKSPEGKAASDSLKDKISNTIGAIDKAARQKQINTTEVLALYAHAEKQMKRLNAAEKTAAGKQADSKRAKREERIAKRKAKDQASEDLNRQMGNTLKKRFNAKLTRTRERVARWQKIGAAHEAAAKSEFKKLKEHKAKRGGLDDKMAKIKERGAKLAKLSEAIKPGHEKYDQFRKAVKAHLAEKESLKSEIAKHSEEAAQMKIKVQRHIAVRKRAGRILQGYKKDIEESKDRATSDVLTKSIQAIRRLILRVVGIA